MTVISRYNEVISRPPAFGDGFNVHVFRVARIGVNAGVDLQRIADDIRRYAPSGNRPTLTREINRAIAKVTNDRGNVIPRNFRQQQKPAFDGDKARNKIISLGAGIEESDIWAASPIKVDWQHEEDPTHLLTCIYRPDDVLFMGDRYSSGKIGKTIKTSTEWRQHFKGGGKTHPHIIPNPLSGQQALTQDGKPTLRGDACVKGFSFAVVEFDNLSRDNQLAFWWGVNLPVVALIDSGNKSIHGWIRIDNVTTTDEWTQEVEQELFKDLMIPMGVDGACRNEARLSRLPGHKRDNGRMQRLLYLAPEGRRVNG